MFNKHTYLILFCLGVLLITLSIGTRLLKEGYDNYLNALLLARGYDLPAPQLPGSSGYALEAKYTCPDGSSLFDHIDTDCSKPKVVVAASSPGTAESCTVSDNSGAVVDSCKSISSFLFCDTSIKKCNTLNTKELAAGQACKYNNECLSRSCDNGKCAAVPSAQSIWASSSTNTASGIPTAMTNLDDYFSLLNTQFNGSFVSNTPSTGPFTGSSTGAIKTTDMNDVQKATTAGASPTQTSGVTPSKNTTQMGSGTRGADFYNKVKILMADDIDASLRLRKSMAANRESESCYDSCC